MLVAAGPYVRSVRHPELRPTEAYLIFTMSFSVAGLFGFSLAILALEASGAPDGGASIAQLLAGSATLLVGWAVGRWLVRQPPRAAPPID